MYVSTLIALTIHSHSDNVTIETLQTIHNDLNLIYSNYVCFISVIDDPNSYHFPSRLDRLGIIISRLQSAYFHSLCWLNPLSRFSKEVRRKQRFQVLIRMVWDSKLDPGAPKIFTEEFRGFHQSL
jgi:hypothetical protein